jgi:hypothetical protein
MASRIAALRRKEAQGSVERDAAAGVAEALAHANRADLR